MKDKEKRGLNRYNVFPKYLYLRNRSALAVSCCVIIHCIEVSCEGDQITSTQGE